MSSYLVAGSRETLNLAQLEPISPRLAFDHIRCSPRRKHFYLSAPALRLYTVLLSSWSLYNLTLNHHHYHIMKFPTKRRSPGALDPPALILPQGLGTNSRGAVYSTPAELASLDNNKYQSTSTSHSHRHHVSRSESTQSTPTIAQIAMGLHISRTPHLPSPTRKHTPTARSDHDRPPRPALKNHGRSHSSPPTSTSTTLFDTDTSATRVQRFRLRINRLFPASSRSSRAGSTNSGVNSASVSSDSIGSKTRRPKAVRFSTSTAVGSDV